MSHSILRAKRATFTLKIAHLEFWHFSSIFVQLKLTCLVTLVDHKLQIFKEKNIFGTFNELLSTQNLNVAHFARNVEWDFFCNFQTLCVFSIERLMKVISFVYCFLNEKISLNFYGIHTADNLTSLDVMTLTHNTNMYFQSSAFMLITAWHQMCINSHPSGLLLALQLISFHFWLLW